MAVGRCAAVRRIGRAATYTVLLVTAVSVAAQAGVSVAVHPVAPAAPVRLGVPAYWSAASPDGAREFDRLTAMPPSIMDKMVVNGPASGPADPFDPELARAIHRLRDRGVTVLGYVDTGYLGRTGAVTTGTRAGSTAVADWLAQATTDAATWHHLYGRHGLGGVFLDQTLAECGPGDAYVAAYRALATTVRRRGGVVAVNPGVAVAECYATAADSIVVVEDSFGAYEDWRPPDWVRRYPAAKFWHLVHGVTSAQQARRAVSLARQRHAGTVYVTDLVIDASGGPWNALPGRPYWSAQTSALLAMRRQPASCPAPAGVAA